MILAFFASFIVFCLWLAYEIRKSRRLGEKMEKSFWALEEKANSTRRKPLDGLAYITIPSPLLSLRVPEESPRLQEGMEVLRTLSTQKIVNLTGWTNTELKLEYGAPNITLLMEFDQNYTLLARTLQTIAKELFIAGQTAEAKNILEFAVSTRTDVSQSYFLLADLYEREACPEKIEELIRTAGTLKSVMKKTIVRTLQESGPYSDLLRSS